jgi:hypothetical protein
MAYKKPRPDRWRQEAAEIEIAELRKALEARPEDCKRCVHYDLKNNWWHSVDCHTCKRYHIDKFKERKNPQ